MKVLKAALFSAIGVAAFAAAATANHKYGTYPNRGLLWMSGASGYSGDVWVSSSVCSSAESSAFTRVHDSTIGTTEMSDWKNGIDMTRQNCLGKWTNDMDIVIKFVSTQDSPGLNTPILNSSAYCSYWEQSYP